MTHPTDTGQKTEAIILAELVKLDIPVLVPFGINHRYDLVVDLGGKFLRVQCKTGRLENGTIKFNRTSVVDGKDSYGTRPYTEDEIDIFAVYCPQTDKCYWMPVAEASWLRVDPPKNNQTKGVQWAKDFELTEAPAGHPVDCQCGRYFECQ